MCGDEYRLLRPLVGAWALLKRPPYSTNGAFPTPNHQTDICTRLTLGLADYADFAWIGVNIL